MSHGVLFIGYVIVATLLKKSQNWNFKILRLSISLSYPLWYFLCRKNTARMFKFIEKYLVIFIQYSEDIGYSTASYLSLFFNITLLCVLAYTMYVVFRLFL
jgi:hypothetical protein